MIIPDINLLLYTYDSRSPFHEKAVRWWQESLSGTEPVGLPRVVIVGFVRVGTNARAFQHPLSPAEAARHVRDWLAQPSVQVLDGGPQHVEQVLKSLESVGTAGNLVTDAQIAAMAIDHGAVVHTSDADFLRFSGVRWFNPISGMGSHSVRKGR